MRARRLWIAAGLLLACGLGAALAVRLSAPTTGLDVRFLADPASLLLGATVLGAAAVAALAWIAQRTERALETALAAQTTSQDLERRRFIQRLDHELKNPLTALQIQLDNVQASSAAAAVSEARLQAERLAQLTRGLRRLADLESRPLEAEPVTLEELLAEARELVDQPERVDVDVQRSPWAIPPASLDRELILMALRNLIENALKYSLPDARVQVRAREEGGTWLIDVVDTGRGIAIEDLPHVAEELYRGGNVRDVAGSGLGLAMAQRIVSRHGGALTVRSRPGQGTIASLRLPTEA